MNAFTMSSRKYYEKEQPEMLFSPLKEITPIHSSLESNLQQLCTMGKKILEAAFTDKENHHQGNK